MSKRKDRNYSTFCRCCGTVQNADEMVIVGDLEKDVTVQHYCESCMSQIYVDLMLLNPDYKPTNPYTLRKVK